MGRRAPVTHAFAHESSFARDLAFVPMYVRYALDRAGVKIGLDDWTALRDAERRDLAERALASDDDGDTAIAVFASHLADALARAGRPAARASAPFDDASLERPSRRLRHNVADVGGALDDAAWRRLATFDRYALVKLGDRDAPSHDLAAAVAELGLRAVGVGGGRVDAAVQGEIVSEHDA